MLRKPISRRSVLKQGLLAATAAVAGPRLVFRAARAATGSRRVLVCVFQRGGVDGLNMVVPHAEARYYELRPGIAVPRPGSGENAALDLDGAFGLHPSMASLLPAWQAGELALVHACGSPAETRSHFDAQAFMERGIPGDKGVPDGWLNRHLQHSPGTEESIFRAVAIAGAEPNAFTGPAETLTTSSLSSLRLGKQQRGVHLRDAVERMYGPREDLLGQTARSALMAVDTAAPLADYVPDFEYPAGQLAGNLRDVAALIKADVGLEVAFVNVGGWDTHDAETTRLAAGLTRLADSLTAFRADVGDLMADVCVVSMSEFGRTAAENGSGGTDHGRATAMLALGGTVAGGRVYGDWPGLDEESLADGRHLAVTTDFRTLFAEILERHMGNGSIDLVFPGLQYGDASRLGVVA